MDDQERRRELQRLADESLNTPNCPGCLHQMEAAPDALEWSRRKSGTR